MSQMAAGPGVAGENLRDDAERHIRRGTPEGRLLCEGLDVLSCAGVSAHSLMRHGRVVDEVVAESRDEAYDLIVIGAFRATGLDRVVLSDQARAILAGTHEPLLVL